MNSAVTGSAPTRPRMPSVPKYFLSLMRNAQAMMPAPTSHRVRRTFGLQDAGKRRLDLRARGIAFGRFVELHADARDAIALGAGRRDPDDLGGNTETLLLVHQREQEKDV